MFGLDIDEARLFLKKAEFTLDENNKRDALIVNGIVHGLSVESIDIKKWAVFYYSNTASSPFMQ